MALPLASLIRSPLTRSQRAAESNAQEALTNLANRRREREDVERFLANRIPAQGGRSPGDRAGRPSR
jgi:hypothetical protein